MTSVTNIPTDLLRTFVTVVDLRSFTKAARSLRVTQPAVSAQIKRLQCLIGAELLDKSAPGVTLTPAGELVVTPARRLLSINDQILHIAGSPTSAPTLRIGLPEDFIGPALMATLAGFREQWPNVRYHLRSGSSDILRRDLRQGELDIAVAFSSGARPLDARHYWSEPLAWIRGPTLQLDPDGPVPLCSYGDESLYHRTAVAALERAGRDTDLVYIGSGLPAIAAAVGSGLGVTVLARNRIAAPDLIAWDHGPLPDLPDALCGVHLRDGGDRTLIEQLWEAVAAALQPAQRERSTPFAATGGPAAATGSAA